MDNILKKMDLDFFGTRQHKINIEEIMLEKEIQFLDVRTREEINAVKLNFNIYSNIETVAIPVNEIPDNISEISKNKTVAIFCPGSIRASFVYTYLLSKKFNNVKVFEGGYDSVLSLTKPGKILKKVK